MPTRDKALFPWVLVMTAVLATAPCRAAQEVVGRDGCVVKPVFEADWRKYSDFDPRIPPESQSWPAQQYQAAAEEIKGCELEIVRLKARMELDRQWRLAAKDLEHSLKTGLKANLLKSFWRLAWVTYSTIGGATTQTELVSAGKAYAELFTEDWRWNADGTTSISLNRLTVQNGRAYLDARHDFTDRDVSSITFGGDGRAYVTHNPSYGYLTRTYGENYYAQPEAQHGSLSIIDLAAAGLPELAKIDLPSWASLQTVTASHAFFSVSGGVLIVDLTTATAPRLSAFYPLQGWPSRIVVAGGRAFVPAAWYGLFALPVE